MPLEGGFYRETYRSPEQVSADLPARYGSPRSLKTAIYYLLTPETFSAIHRVPGEEVFHFYMGDPVEMLMLQPDEASHHPQTTRIEIGPDLRTGQQLQVVVPGGVWQGTRLITGGRWALMGTTMSPGFDPRDFELGEREGLLRDFPGAAEMIRVLTR